MATEDVLEAALESFAEKGFDGTSVRELARGLGVSHNLIPQRIGTKEELWSAAIDHGFTYLAVEMAEMINQLTPADDLETLRAMVVRFVELMASRPALLRVIQQEASVGGPRFEYLWSAFIDPVRWLGGDLLHRLREAGRVRTESVGLFYFFMTHGAGGPLALPAMAERFGMVVDPKDPVAVRRHAEAAVDLLFGGLVGEVSPAAVEG